MKCETFEALTESFDEIGEPFVPKSIGCRK